MAFAKLKQGLEVLNYAVPCQYQPGATSAHAHRPPSLTKNGRPAAGPHVRRQGEPLPPAFHHVMESDPYGSPMGSARPVAAPHLKGA